MDSKTLLICRPLCLALCVSLVQSAKASDNENTLSLDKLVVLSGEKGAYTLSDTANSVALITEADVAPQDSDVANILQKVPNVLDVSTGVAPTIRGQKTQGAQEGATAFFAGTTPRATISVDGRYQSYFEYVNGGTGLWDVNSIEIYRGPQTITQGANSIAGAITVNTNDPSFTPEYNAQILGGNYNMRRGSFTLSGPISEDFAYRFAADHFSRDNYVKVTEGGTQPTNTDRDYETQTYRTKLQWAPRYLPELEAMLTYAHVKSNQPTSEAVPFPYEGGKLVTDNGAGPTWSQQSDSVIADISYDLDNGITISNQLVWSTSETDRVLEDVTDGSANIETDDVTNEVKFSWGDNKSTFSGVASLFLARNKQDDKINLESTNPRSGITNGGISLFETDKFSQGLFVQSRWRTSPRWSMTAGLRLQRDSIERSGIYNNFISGSAYDVAYDKSFTELLPSVGVRYEIQPGTQIGAQISKGYNPGGSGINFITNEYYEYHEESVINYEVFWRSSLLADTLFISANLFNSQFRDQQVIVGRSTLNADRSKTYGLELSADYQVTPALRLAAGFGLLKSEINKFEAAPAVEGNELERAPATSISLSANWDATERLNIKGDLRHVSSYYSDTINTQAYKVDGYQIANLSASYDISDQIEAFGYVNNLFDERSETWVRAATGTVTTRVTDPRMVGIGIKVSF